jgi:hypothetical protein
MTQRYAHLRDEVLIQASSLVADLIKEAVAKARDKEKAESADNTGKVFGPSSVLVDSCLNINAKYGIFVVYGKSCVRFCGIFILRFDR